MSDLVEERLLAILGAQTTSPYGNTIPGLDELGVGGEERILDRVGISVEHAIAAGIEKAQVTRIGEPAQAAPGVLDHLVAGSILPGSEVAIAWRSGEITLDAGEGPVVVDDFAARHIFVSL